MYKRMFSSITGVLNKLKENKLVQNIAGNISQNYERLKEQVGMGYEVLEVLPQIYHVAFPEVHNVGKLREHIGASEFQIWNVSEYRYQKEVEMQLLRVPEQGQINHLCFAMYSNLPFYELALALHTIPNFLRCNKTNKVYIHCQDNKIRSAVLLACYVYQHNIEGIQDISDAILWVNKTLNVRLQELEKKNMYKNVHLLFKNFVNYRNNANVINKRQLKLLKIIFNSPPVLTISERKPVPFGLIRVNIQVRCGEATIFNKTFKGTMIQGNLLCIPFDKSNLVLSDEFLIIVKYVHEGKMYNIMRVQLNTNFIYMGFSRVHGQNIDTSPSFALVDPENPMHVDFIFEELEQLSRLGLLSQDQSRQQQQQQQKQQQKQRQQLKIQIETDLNHKLEVQAKQSQLQKQAVHSQAIARLNEATTSPTHQLPQSAQTLQEQITKKLMTALKIAPQAPSNADSQGSSSSQDLQDYLSKLQSQA